MKKAILGLFILGMSFACTSKDEYEIGQKTKIEVQTHIDAGQVMLGENVKTTLDVKNKGSYPLILASVNGSCSCTIANYPKDPIAPGETKQINVIIETKHVGKLAKDVRISANTEPSLTTVIIEADVIDKVK